MRLWLIFFPVMKTISLYINVCVCYFDLKSLLEDHHHLLLLLLILLSVLLYFADE